MTKTREENARDLQLEEVQEAIAEDLADSDRFECTQCRGVLDIEESLAAGDDLLCELCGEQFKANGVIPGETPETTSEPIVFDRIVRARSDHEWEEPVDAARLQLTESFVRRVLEVAELVKGEGFASVRMWSYHAEWGFWDDDEVIFHSASDPNSPRCGDFRSEGNQVMVCCVGDVVSVIWTAYWKHTNLQVSTDEVYGHELIEGLRRATNGVSASE